MPSVASRNQARHTRRLVRLLPALLLLLVLIPEAAPRTALAADPTFGFPMTLPNSNGTASSVAIGDLNRDGSDDIVLGNLYDLNTLASSPSQVYLNPGTGDFSAAAPV